MTKQEKIEEMASSIGDCNTTCDECFKKLESVMTLSIPKRENYCQVYAYARRAVKQGYQKLPEDSVVLSKEEYNDYLNLKDLLDKGYFTSENRVAIHKARKETAKEILDYFDQYAGNGELIGNIINRLRRKYSVEVRE